MSAIETLVADWIRVQHGGGSLDPRVVVGARYHDDSHPEESDFTVVNWDPEDPDSVDLDNGQWYELDGPEGMLAKLDQGIIRRA